MGAMPWMIIGPYDSNHQTALRLVQRRYFDENYNLPQIVKQLIAQAQACVEAVQEQDEYQLLETYQLTLDAVQEIAAEGIPEDKDSQISMLRRMTNARGDSLNNILDVQEVSPRLEEWHVAPLSPSQLNDCFSTSFPTLSEVNHTGLGRVYSLLDRAQAVSFPLYEAGAMDVPAGIMYVGYSAD